MVLKYDPKNCLPSSAELPDSDDTPVDNELQNIIPNLLNTVLAMVWAEREDWFFGVDMGIYYAPSTPAIVPDGFLSLGVERFVGEEGRLGYVFWEEDNIPPTLALEVVSKTYGGEYERKKSIYAELGILYYVVYRPNPSFRRQRQPLEIYKLGKKGYQLISHEPVWMPEIGLGLGRERGTHMGLEREWLYWYDNNGTRLLTPEEVAAAAVFKAKQEAAKAEQARDKAERLAQKLKELGIDPDTL